MPNSKQQLLSTKDPIEQHKQLYLLAYQDQERGHRRFRYLGILVAIIAFVFPPVSLILTMPFLRHEFAKTRTQNQVDEHLVNNLAKTEKDKKWMSSLMKPVHRLRTLLNVLNTVSTILFAISPIFSGAFIFGTVLGKLLKARRKQDVIVSVSEKDGCELRTSYKETLDRLNIKRNVSEQEKIIWEKVPNKPKKVFITSDHKPDFAYVLMDRAQATRTKTLRNYLYPIRRTKIKNKTDPLLSNMSYIPFPEDPCNYLLPVVKGKFFSDSQRQSIELVAGLEKKYGLRK